MRNWLYKGEEITEVFELPEGTIGFVYRITHRETGKFYIGKKILHSTQKKALTKREIAEWDKPGKVPKKRVVVKENDWRTYHGSSKTLVADVKTLGHSAFHREILRPCKTKKEMTYWEMYYQFTLKVLHVESYNDNIAGKLFRKDTGDTC